MFEDFIYKYRFLIGAILVVVIICGGYLIWRDKVSRTKTNFENREIAELRAQNELLREQLSQEATKQVAAAQESNAGEEDKINLNTASAEELDILPGIGPVRAADIIAYREENGGFKNIEELKNIKGIGDKSFEDLKDLITVGATEELE